MKKRQIKGEESLRWLIYLTKCDTLRIIIYFTSCRENPQNFGQKTDFKATRCHDEPLKIRPHVALCVLILLNFYVDLDCPGKQWLSNLIILRDTVVGHSGTCLMFAVTVLFVVLMSMF